ncbi:MAG TPA: O-antigen ligase family protein [Acidimicrobiales bacterium]|nr:O-antigen ligase family protein [Acidimicrobiales bacterium]
MITTSLRRQAPYLVPVAILTVAVGLGVVLPTVTAMLPWRDIVLFLVGAVVVWAAWARPSLSIVLVVGTFVFSAGVRRLLPAVDPNVDPAAILPFIVALPLAVHGICVRKPVAVALLVLWITVRAAFSFAVPLAGLAGWLDLTVPLLAAFGIARIPSGLSTFVRATVVCGSIAAIYGIVQYFVPFPWDVEWLMRANLDSAGQPGSTNFRPFSTLPAPGTAALLSAVVILIVVFRGELVWRSPVLRAVALTSSSTFLLLTQVRSVWLALIASLVVGSLAAGGRPARQILPLGAFVVAVVLILPPGEVVVERLNTLSNLPNDDSYRHRVDAFAKTGTIVSPLGLGVGELSSARRVGGGNPIDNGYLVILGELGLVGAVLMMAVLAWLVRRSCPPEYAFATMLLVSSATALAFGNFPGLMLWTLSGVGRPEADERTRADTGAIDHPAAQLATGS